MNSEPIKFWHGSRGDYSCFSNFSKHDVVSPHTGDVFPTSEHFYQAMKTTNRDDFNRVRSAATPKLSKQIANSLPIKEGWHDYKITVMKHVLILKFEQHEVVRQKLYSTLGLDIQEDSPYDYFWGIGKDGSGENHLGKLWVAIRKEKFDV